MNNRVYQRIDPDKTGRYDNSHVDFTKPVQYGIWDQREGWTEWCDCVVDPSGQLFRAGICGTGKQWDINSWPLRNTPLSNPDDIAEWYKAELRKLSDRHHEMLVRAEQLKSNILYRAPKEAA